MFIDDDAKKDDALEKNPSPELNAEPQEDETEEEFEIVLDGQKESNDAEKPSDDDLELEEIIKSLPEKAQKLPSILRKQVKEKSKALREKEKETLELQMKIAEIEKQIQSVQKPQEYEVLQEPTLEDCGYDAEIFKESLLKYHAQKQKIEAEKAKAQEKEVVAKKQFQARLEQYNASKTKYADIDLAEKRVIANLPIALQDLIVQYAEKPENIVYILGKTPALLDKMKGLTPVEFAIEMGKLEKTASIQSTRKPAVAPEGKAIENKSKGILDLDEKLRELEDEAFKTGNRTKVLQFKRANNLM